MEPLRRDRLFVALTRPQLFAGVTYSLFIINFVVSAELFLVFRTFWILIPALGVHILGMIVSLREPRIVELWITRASLCGRVRNHSVWRCNSYRP
jgi:type IV secretion system protein VirB3